MHASQRVLPSRMAGIHAPSTPTQALLGKQSSLLAVIDDLCLYDEHIVIPQALRLHILDCIPCDHLDISKCCARAYMSVWWPGLSVAIEDMVKVCFTCAKELPEPKEPLMPSSFPSCPWERISMDLFWIWRMNIPYHCGLLFHMGWNQSSHNTNYKECVHSCQRAICNPWYTRYSDFQIMDPVLVQYPFQSFATKYGFVQTN